MYVQELEPVDKLARPVRPRRGPAPADRPDPARRGAHDGAPGGPDGACGGRSGRLARLRHATRPDALQRRPRSRLRPLPHPVDRRQRPVGVPDDRPYPALRHPAPLLRAPLRRPAHPGARRRVLLRRASGSPRRIRCAGRDLLGHARRPGLRPGACRGRGARRQHRAGRVRCDGHAGRDARAGDGTAAGFRGLRGGTSNSVAGTGGSARPGLAGGRTARSARDLGARPGVRSRLRRGPVRRLQLRLRATRRHRSVLGGRGRPDRRTARTRARHRVRTRVRADRRAQRGVGRTGPAARGPARTPRTR